MIRPISDEHNESSVCQHPLWKLNFVAQAAVEGAVVRGVPPMNHSGCLLNEDHSLCERSDLHFLGLGNLCFFFWGGLMPKIR